MRKYPTQEEALALLDWAHDRNPGPWRAHSLGVARAAREIARAAGMDAQHAYVNGLLHDIGRYEGVRALHHIIAGYELLLEKGWDGPARICITHSFPDGQLAHYGGGAKDVTPQELARIEEMLREPFDEDDRLIQLCDELAWGEGVCLMEKRLVDVALRYGACEGMIENWKRWFEIKASFEKRIGGSIYALFPECARVTLGC